MYSNYFRTNIKRNFKKKLNYLLETYFTVLAVLSPHSDIMKSFHDLTAQWMTVNAVLNDDKTIDANAGQEWLSYKKPKARIELTNKLTTKIHN